MIINPSWKSICLERLFCQSREGPDHYLPSECLDFEQRDFDAIEAVCGKYCNNKVRDFARSLRHRWMNNDLPSAYSFMDFEAEVRSRLLYRKRWNIKEAITSDLDQAIPSYEEYSDVSYCIREGIIALERRDYALDVINEVCMAGMV